jgi:hypothetical protein
MFITVKPMEFQENKLNFHLQRDLGKNQMKETMRKLKIKQSIMFRPLYFKDIKIFNIENLFAENELNLSLNEFELNITM